MSSGSLAGAQLDALLTGDWLTRGPLLLSEDLTPRELESSLALENARRFLATLLEAGALPATSDGALAHEALDRLLDILRWGAPDYGARVRAEFRADLREGDVQPVRIMRLVLERLGLMERGDGVFLPTVDTAGALEQQRAAWLFARMFRAYFRDFDHARSDAEDPAPEIHRHSAYSLWVIGQVGDAWWQTEDLLRLLLPRRVLAAETRRLTRLVAVPPVRPGSGSCPVRSSFCCVDSWRFSLTIACSSPRRHSASQRSRTPGTERPRCSIASSASTSAWTLLRTSR